ncbi:MAG: MotA/TolQ/ExbB proton channel family protein [Verrucomicrobiales bacterium]
MPAPTTPPLTSILHLADFTDGLRSVWRFLASGGVFMGLIVVCSIMAVAAVIAKFVELREKAVMPRQTVDVLTKLATGREVSDAQIQGTLQGDDSPLATVARAALLVPHRSKEEAMASAQTVAREEVIRLERGVPLIESIIAAGPLLGLLGAVVGLTRVFKALRPDVTDPSLIAVGIAEALNTTIAGLVVAIPCVFFHSHFSRRIEHLAARMEVLVEQALSACFAAPPRSTPPQ